MGTDGTAGEAIPLRATEEPGQTAWVRHLFERRIVFLRGVLDAAAADDLAAQLIALDAGGSEAITLFIDSSGGDAASMFTIHDTMEMLRSPVDTRCVGQAASAAAFLLATGTGRRSATRNARIVLRQPDGAGEGTAQDIEQLAGELGRMRAQFERILAARTGKDAQTIRQDTERGLWLSADEALDYGLLDDVVTASPGRPVRGPA